MFDREAGGARGEGEMSLLRVPRVEHDGGPAGAEDGG